MVYEMLATVEFLRYRNRFRRLVLKGVFPAFTKISILFKTVVMSEVFRFGFMFRFK